MTAGACERVTDASMARRSASQTSWNLEKSWIKPVWMTPSDDAAPFRRLLRSSRSPGCTSAPAEASDLGARVGTGEAEHLVARGDEILNDGGTDKSTRAGNENTHQGFSLDLLFRP